ncbi:50S ribosomal protein L10 [Candidatus Kapabacteria bacterium]|nr:50S ribosomal protein L10 [Candidatus Kapabacteria bacterium]
MTTIKKKKEIVEDLTGRLEKASGVYIVDFATMDVAQVNKFRSELKATQSEYIVVKNTLIRKALDQVDGKEIPKELLKGQSGVILTYEDPTVPSKIIKKAFDKTQKPKLKAALLDGQLFDGTQLKQIAALPSKEDMIASIMGSLSAPASGIAGSLGAVIRDIASIIEEAAKKREAA